MKTVGRMSTDFFFLSPLTRPTVYVDMWVGAPITEKDEQDRDFHLQRTELHRDSSL